MTVKLTKDQLGQQANGPLLYNIMQAVLHRENLIDREKEHFWVAGLDLKYRLLFIELVTLGNDYTTTADPTAVFALALQKECRCIIAVHNHPSGRTQPSDADNIMTETLFAIGKFLRCRLHDHLIIGANTYYSFRESGQLAPLERRHTGDLMKILDRLHLTHAAFKESEEELKEKLELLGKKNEELRARKKEISDLKRAAAKRDKALQKNQKELEELKAQVAKLTGSKK